MAKTRTRTKTTKVEKMEEELPENKPQEEVKPNHILSISDETGSPLLFIGENFNKLPLESKISVIQHLKTFIDGQKSSIIKMIEDI
jgi:hypothetical protein